MPLPAIRVQKPNASEIFTDRLDERELLSRVLAPVPTSDLGPEFTITVVYGVGGVGKTRLCEHGLEIAGNKFPDRVICAYVNFDAQGWHPETSFSLVAAELCRGLHRAGLAPRLSTALLALQHVAPVGGGDERWGLVLDGLDKGVEMSGIPGLSLLVKAGLAVRDRVQQTKLRQRLQDLGLWPLETAGQINLMDLQEKLALALHHDVVDFLVAHPERHLRFFVDGFERLQSHANQRDTQWHLQSFAGYFAASAEPAAGRFRVLLFGREKLRWDELYQDPTWSRYWNQHLLGGLAQADALDFLRKCQTWHRSRGQSTLADALARHEVAMLDASDEQVRGQQVYYPFFLNLATDLVERASASGAVLDLGRAPVELQERFLRYLDQTEKRALQILALAETFDEKLFDWLAGERLIGYERSTFHSQLRQERSYFQAVEGRAGEWKLHRKMEDALHALWHSTPAEQHEGRAIVLRLLDYYATPLRAKEERDWGDAEVEAWRRGMEIIVTQGPEGAPGLLPVEKWAETLPAGPWPTALGLPERLVSIKDMMTLEFAKRDLSARARRTGWEDEGTFFEAVEFVTWARLLGAYSDAEQILRQLLVVDKQHPTWFDYDGHSIAAEFGGLLFSLGKIEEALAVLLDAARKERAVTPPDCWSLRQIILQECIVKCLIALGEYELAFIRAEEALRGADAIWGKDDRERLFCLRIYGVTLVKIGKEWNYSEAIRSLEEAYIGSKKTCEAGEPNEVVLSAIEWARACRWEALEGSFERAYSLCEEAISLADKRLGDKHPVTCEAKCELGVLHQYVDCERAYQLISESVVGLSRSLGAYHITTLESKLELALALCNLCRFPEALEIIEGHHNYLPVRFRLENEGKTPKHPLMHRTLQIRGMIQERQGEIDKAITTLRGALDLGEEVNGYGHPDTILTLVLLGISLVKKGATEEIKAIKRRVKFFEDEFPSVSGRIRYEYLRFRYLGVKAIPDSEGESPSDIKRKIKIWHKERPTITKRFLLDGDFAEFHKILAAWK